VTFTKVLTAYHNSIYPFQHSTLSTLPLFVIMVSKGTLAFVWQRRFKNHGSLCIPFRVYGRFVHWLLDSLGSNNFATVCSVPNSRPPAA
jgi:hypothetical protein